MVRVPGSNVAITPIFDPDVSPGGLYIPEMAKERCDQGIVKYCGPLVKWISEGDYVLFSGYSGTLLQVEDEGKLIIIPERFIIAKLEAESIDVPGVYFRSPDGVYFTATYEMVVELVAEAFKESPWFTRNKLSPKALELRKTAQDRGISDRHVFSGHAEEDLVPDLPLKDDTNVAHAERNQPDIVT